MPSRAAPKPKASKNNTPTVPILNLAKKCNCVACGKEIVERPRKSSENSIDCDKCGHWFHVQDCTNLTTEQWDVLSEADQEEMITWNCPDCIKDKGRDYKRMSKIEEAIFALTMQVGNVAQKLDSFEDKITKIVDKRIDEKLDAKFEDKFREMEKKINVQGPTTEVTTDEKEDREKRKLNIVMVNIPESVKEDQKERREDDLKRVTELLGTCSDIEEGDLQDPVRLGELDPKEKRPRFLRLTVKTSAKKGTILRNARNLNTDDTVAPKNRFYINQDLTPSQRKTDAEKRGELNRRKLAGEKHLKMRRGQIISDPPKDVPTDAED